MAFENEEGEEEEGATAAGKRPAKAAKTKARAKAGVWGSCARVRALLLL